MTFERADEQSVIRLEGAMEIAQAADLKSVLLDAIKREKPICLVLEGVTHLDITAVQLLWATEREARRAGLNLRCESEVPEPVRAALKGAGLDGFPLC
jgi:anti-anti-sigma factor